MPDHDNPSDGSRAGNGNLDPLHYLSDRQLNAIDSLVAGNSITDAAEHAGVSRTTIYNWQALVAFKTELNRRRAELHNHVNDLVRVIDRSAMVQTANMIEDGDREAIFTWLKARGLNRLDTAPAGPTDVDEALRAAGRDRYDRIVEVRTTRHASRQLAIAIGDLPLDPEAVEALVRWEAARRACESGDADPASLPRLEDVLASLDLDRLDDVEDDLSSDDD